MNGTQDTYQCQGYMCTGKPFGGVGALLYYRGGPQKGRTEKDPLAGMGPAFQSALTVDDPAAALLGSLSSRTSRKRRRLAGLESPTSASSRASSSTNRTAVTLSDDKKKAFAQKRLLTKSSEAQQTFLDFGQRSCGRRTLCGACGLLFVNGEREDETHHAAYCRAQRKGIQFPGWKNERVVFRGEGEDRILEVRPNDGPGRLDKMAEVKAVMDSDMSFSVSGSSASTPQAKEQPAAQARKLSDLQPSVGEDSGLLKQSQKAYLFVRDRRVVGCVVAEKIERAFPIAFGDPGREEEHEGEKVREAKGFCGGGHTVYIEEEGREASLGVVQMWVDEGFRRRGLAHRLLDCVRERFFFGHVVPRARLAFSQLSSMGCACASRYMEGVGHLLVY